MIVDAFYTLLTHYVMKSAVYDQNLFKFKLKVKTVLQNIGLKVPAARTTGR
jgi:hypothetical protein